MGAPQGIARSSDARSAGRCGIRVETLGKEPEMKVCLDQRLGDRALLTGRGGYGFLPTFVQLIHS